MSYVLVTSNNKVIVVDGGWAGDAPYLKSLINSFGGHVDAWFISHPHQDHVEALSEILAAPEGITIGTVYHTKVSQSNNVITTFYSRLDAFGCDVVDIREPGGRYDIDGVGIKVLSVKDELLNSNINDSSLALRIWDSNKSVVLLGDCMVAEGRKLLATCPEDLNCDFLQLGHHGNKGPEKSFYDAVSFHYALVPTADWIWYADLYYTPKELLEKDNLDGGATRRWIEARLPAKKIITSYEHGDVWLDNYGNTSFMGNTIEDFISGESDYFN
jgi:beta-lactamase superfamily II metal-dependent hydrolase